MPDNSELAAYKTMQHTAASLRAVADKYRARSSQPECDKYGIGFNVDDRFSVFRVALTFCNWFGYYGSSGCTPHIYLGDGNTVKRYFLRWLNENYQMIFDAMAAAIEKDSVAMAKAAAHELEGVLDELHLVLNSKGSEAANAND
jgi:hypothetical protein